MTYTKTLLAIVAFAMATLAQFPSTVLATPVAPDSGATNLNPDSIVLVWNQLPEVDHYLISAGRSGGFGSLGGSVEDTSMVLENLFANSEYWWDITTFFNDGGVSTSSRWTFTTGDNPPSAVSVISPLSYVEAGVQPELSWYNTYGATGYRVQLSDDTSFSNLIIDEDVGSDTTKQASGLSDETTYYWRVQGYNGTSAGAWSMRTMFIMAKLGKTAIVSPPTGDTVDMSSSLTWNSLSGSILYYTVEIAQGDFSSPVLSQAYDTTIELSNVNGLEYNTTYLWRVYGQNNYGAGEYSDTGSFSVGSEPLTVPTLLSPPDGETEIKVSDTLKWTASNGNGYIVEISDTNDFTSPTTVNTSDTLLDLSTVSGIEQGVTYYWQVKTYRDTDTSVSAAASFTTKVPTAIMPTANVVRTKAQPQMWVVDMRGRRVMKTARIAHENLPRGCYLMVAPNRAVTKNLLVR